MLAALVVASACTSLPASGASSSVVVTMTVASASEIDTTGCGTGAATSFGTVQPGTTAVTTTPCAIRFGSSNDTAMLQVRQADTYGQAMFRPTLGGFDGGFNTTGWRITAPTAANDNSYALTTQADGKVVNAGWTNASGGGDLLFGRHTTTGGMDGSFGASGIATIDVAGAGLNDIALDVLQQPSTGRIIFSGINNSNFLVGRLNAAGTALDPTFGSSSGYTATNINGNDRANAIAVQPDGKIVIVGGSRSDGTNDDLSVMRFSADGVVDQSFGTNGIYTYDNGGWEYAYDVFVQPSGRIVVVGARGNEALLLGLTPSGAPDGSFGVGGFRVAQPGGLTTRWTKSAQLPSGGFIAAGNVTAADSDTTLAKYDVNGVLDTNFGASGYLVRTMAGSDGAAGVVGEGDGRVTVAINANNDLLTTRYSGAGQLDTTFGTNGISTLDTGAVDDVYDVGPGPDGTLYATGRTGASGNWNWEVMRLGALTVPNYGGGVTWGSAGGMFGMCLATLTGTGASPTWGPAGAGNCTATDVGSYWHGVATANDKVAASTTAGTTNVTANFHFGVRTSASQSPGSYVAPITFEVSAPNV